MRSTVSFRSWIHSSASCSTSVLNGPGAGAHHGRCRQGSRLAASVDPGLGALVSVTAVNPFGQVAAELGKAATDGSQPFELDMPVGVGAVGWEFRAVDVHGREHRVGWPIEAEHGFRIGGDVRDACWQRSITGYCNLLTDTAVAEAHIAALAADELSIEVGLIGLGPADCADARLLGRVTDVPVRRVEPVDQTAGEVGVRGVRLVFPLVAARWGGPELPLPSDDYRVVLGSGARVLCSDRLASRYPAEGMVAKHRYQLARNNRNELVISLRARPWLMTSAAGSLKSG